MTRAYLLIATLTLSACDASVVTVHAGGSTQKTDTAPDPEPGVKAPIVTTPKKETPSTTNTPSASSAYLARRDYGQLLEPQGNAIIFGSGQGTTSDAAQAQASLASATNFRTALGEVSPAAFSVYVAFQLLHPKWNTTYGRDLNTLLDKIDPQRRMIPLIAIHFANQLKGRAGFPTGDTLFPNVAANTADGTGITFDDYTDNIVNVQLAEIERPIFLRLGYEFNRDDLGHINAGDYQKSFVRFARKVHQANRRANWPIALVWNMAASGRCDYVNYYPLDENGRDFDTDGRPYVDWFGINLFAANQFPKLDAGTDKYGIATSCANLGKSQPIAEEFLALADQHKRPVMIPESTVKGSVAKSAWWSDWFSRYFAFIQKRPQIKAFFYIATPWAAGQGYGDGKSNDTSLTPVSGGCDATANSKEVACLFRKEIKSGPFLQALTEPQFSVELRTFTP